MRASLESSVGRGAHGETCGSHWTRGGYPLGLSIDTIWEKLCQGVSGIGPITRFDAHEYSAQIAGEVQDFTPEHYIDKRDLRRMDRFVHYALAASHEAVQDAGLSITESMADRIGVYIGTAFGGLESLEAVHRTLLEKGPNRVSPLSGYGARQSRERTRLDAFWGDRAQ